MALRPTGRPERLQVLVDGAFDPLHKGHLAYFSDAAAYGELICRVATDAEVAERHVPVLPQAERAAVVGALPQIAGVLTRCSTLEAIRRGEWSHYVKGQDWQGRLPADQVKACRIRRIEIVYTNTVRASSSRYVAQQDAAALKRFAQVAETQPPPQAWQPVTDYSYAARAKLEATHANRILRYLVPCADADILDYGCGPGHLIRLIHEQKEPHEQITCIGYDPQTYAGEYRNVRHTPPELEPIYDVVICREVLEHVRLRDYAPLVGRLCQYAAGLLYLTTRFHQSPRHLLDVATSDALDPTHITMPTKALLRALIVMHGFRQRADLEDMLDWQKKGRVLVYERLP